MAHEEPKDEASASSADVPPEAMESPDRRSFLKGTLTVASAVAAGGLAASVSAAEQAPAEQPRAAAQRISGTVHAHFDSRKQPTLEDLQSALRQIVGRAGCPTCGLGGIDIRLHLSDPVEVQSRVPVSVVVERPL
jgi:anaerobic selenocysteine-containing dehydrogenase